MDSSAVLIRTCQRRVRERARSLLRLTSRFTCVGQSTSLHRGSPAFYLAFAHRTCSMAISSGLHLSNFPFASFSGALGVGPKDLN
jgi:hypothetical protein